VFARAYSINLSKPSLFLELKLELPFRLFFF
jgi:hypothetical protein